jgi:cAMP phosphodiesterase
LRPRVWPQTTCAKRFNTLLYDGCNNRINNKVWFCPWHFLRFDLRHATMAIPLYSANWIERNDSAIDYSVSCDKLSPDRLRFIKTRLVMLTTITLIK